MSSILKALKKLEKETLEQQGEPRLSMGLNIRSEKSRRQKRPMERTKRSTPWVWLVSLILIFLGAGTFMTLFSHDRHSRTVVSNTASANHKTMSTAKPEIAVTDSPQFIESEITAQPLHSDRKIQEKTPPTKIPPHRAEEPQEIAPTTPAIAKTQTSNTPMDHALPPGAPSSAPLAMTKASAPAISEEPSEPAPAATHENRVNGIDNANGIPGLSEIPSLNDNSLIINAIAWSNDPAKRLAVINSAIVRQGQSIGEFLLVKIEEDQVIVQQSGKKWKVVFR